MHILLLEDSDGPADVVTSVLISRGHRITRATTLAEAASLVDMFDLAIVDRMLPDGDGLAHVRARRTAGDELPVLILTALGLTEDKVEGFEAGSDDYLVKPFASSELVARVEALGRRARRGAVTELRIGDLVVDRLSRQALHRGCPIALQPREYELLEALIAATPDCVTRTMLLERVWRIRFDPGTNIVESHLSRLRAKLHAAGVPEIIHTVRGQGYAARP